MVLLRIVGLKKVAWGIFRCAVSIRARASFAVWSRLLGDLGAGTRISPTVRIYRPRRVFVGRTTSINDFVHIWGGGGVRIGSDCLIAAHTVITSQSHDSNALSKGVLYRQTSVARPVAIGDNVWIGSNAVILPGVAIGDGAIIGAGAVVTKDVPSRALVIGVPARVARML